MSNLSSFCNHIDWVSKSALAYSSFPFRSVHAMMLTCLFLFSQYSHREIPYVYACKSTIQHTWPSEWYYYIPFFLLLLVATPASIQPTSYRSAYITNSNPHLFRLGTRWEMRFISRFARIHMARSVSRCSHWLRPENIATACLPRPETSPVHPW